jgi:serine/threonine protein kinase
VQNEIRATTKLCNRANRHIIAVLGSGEYPNSSYAYIDMEICTMSLDDYIRHTWGLVPIRGRPKEEGIWNIMKEIALGLTFVHEQKEIHRDLKPSNGSSMK